MGVFKKKDPPQTPSAEDQFLKQFDTLGEGYEGLLDIYKQYEPKFLEQSLETSKQYAPEFAQLDRSIQEQVNPEGFSALGQLSKALSSKGDLTSLNLSPEIQRALQQDVRGAQYARGMTLSPVSALSEAQATLPHRIAERDKWLNLAGSLSGRAPTTGTPNVSSTGFGSMGTPQIGDMTSLQQESNKLAFARWDREQQERARRTRAIGTAIGAGVGGMTGIGVLPGMLMGNIGGSAAQGDSLSSSFDIF